MKAFKYSDIALIPNYSDCVSRSDCDTSAEIAGRRYRLPVYPSNMKAVVGVKQCRWLSENDYFYTMHRFDIDIQKFIEDGNRDNWKTISVSLGVKSPDRALIENIRSSGARVDFVTIDIAHGYSRLMCDMIRFVRENLGKKVCIIAGNVCTPDAVVALSTWGADYVKVGIGQGSPCTTKDKTGFTLPMFTTVRKCKDCYESHEDFNLSKRIPIIADGGVIGNGDIAKALAGGADLVMAGGLFACCSDSPSHSIEINGMLHKAYYGSASFENKRTRTHIEGTLKNIPSCGMNLKTKLIEIEEDLKSSISYGGGKDISCFKDVKFIEVSQ
jgi:GMP reductase